MKSRTFNTLFMLSSVDGKITTGSTDARDIDKDFPLLEGISQGLKQYYDLEKKTDRYSLNTGKVMAKIGLNSDRCKLHCPDVSFIIIDNSHLTLKGIKNLVERTKRLYLITSNKAHPAFKVRDCLELIYYPGKIMFSDLFKRLKQRYDIQRVTIQSGGTLNSILLRGGLIDRISFVFAPALIGGADTSTLVDGKSLVTSKDLSYIKTLRLIKCQKLKHSYLHLVYDLVNK
jgi:2,5-diamino-6-(ribosylamino)-4(3H)-pyrimidinone 5'-phosphate reductase